MAVNVAMVGSLLRSRSYGRHATLLPTSREERFVTCDGGRRLKGRARHTLANFRHLAVGDVAFGVTTVTKKTAPPPENTPSRV